MMKSRNNSVLVKELLVLEDTRESRVEETKGQCEGEGR